MVPKEEAEMARKRHSNQGRLKNMRRLELDLAVDSNAAKARRLAGISDVTIHMAQEVRPHGTAAVLVVEGAREGGPAA